MRPDFFVDMGLDVSPISLACPKCRNVEGRVLPFSEQRRVQHWFSSLHGLQSCLDN
jgi:hypothetical protein